MKGKMTVSHTKFQYYRHNYCLICMTGILGCRWHRYQQSTRENRLRDLFWFCWFVLALLYIVFFFYFWLIAGNDYNMLEAHLFDLAKKWIHWYGILLPLTCAAFGYFILVMLLCFCHICHGHQLFIHPVHMVLAFLSLSVCVAFTVVISKEWNSQFHVIYLSLQMFGPFLHVGAVAIMTVLMWLVSGSWYKLSKRVFQLLWLIAIVVFMVGLYISPLFIKCPCVASNDNAPQKPKLLAHRGAEGIAPENTEMSFLKALEYGPYGLESDVRISFDGVPFVHHDDTFERTTNIKQVFPDRTGEDVSLFNISDILVLDSGSWFLELDPYGTAESLSKEKRNLVRSQKILLLENLTDIAAKADVVLMFDVREPPVGHPFHGRGVERVNKVVQSSTLHISKLWWLIEEGLAPGPVGVDRVYPVRQNPGAPSLEQLREANASRINFRYDHVSADQIRAYHRANISTNVYVIDVPWFYSYYWCLDTTSLTTRRIDILSKMNEPNWTMAPSSYFIMWVSIDVLSAVIIIVIFVVQRIRLFGTSFRPESISLTSGRRARAHRSKNMKEKLLREGVVDPVEEPGLLNHPMAYSMSSVMPPVVHHPSYSSGMVGLSSARVGPIDQKYELD